MGPVPDRRFNSPTRYPESFNCQYYQWFGPSRRCIPIGVYHRTHTFLDCITFCEEREVSTTTESSMTHSSLLRSTTPTSKLSSTDEVKTIVAFQILLPTVMVLIAICFILGIVLIIKSYMMTPLKQNLAVAIRRKRRLGHAPENQYIPPEEMHTHQQRRISERKSLPPPEVLQAARTRAAQLLNL